MSKNYVRAPIGMVDMNMNVNHARRQLMKDGKIYKSVFFSKRKAVTYMNAMTPVYEIPVYFEKG